MSILPLLMVVAFAFTCVCAFSSNRDLFSPVKLYLLTMFVCFLDIFITPYRPEICCVYVGLLTLAVGLSRLEFLSFAPEQAVRRASPRAPSDAGAVALLWALMAIPIALMAYLVWYFGGPAEYLAQLPSRSLSFRGLNSFSEPAINLASLLTVVYFGIGVSRKRSVGWWLLYSVHCTIAFMILSAPGSRRYLLMAIIMMLGLVHYLRSEISMRTAGAFLVLVLVITSLAAVLRQEDSGSLERELRNQELTSEDRESLTAHFKYGLVPFEVIFDANVLNLHYGSTFLAAITNIIPRPLWPGKPDGAGPAITKDYLGDRWLGASNLNANFIVESIMNLGFTVGLPFGFLGLAGAMVLLVRSYRRTMVILRTEPGSTHAVFASVRYFQLALAITGLVTWETAVVTVPLLLNLGALWAIERILAPQRGAPTKRSPGLAACYTGQFPRTQPWR